MVPELSLETIKLLETFYCQISSRMFLQMQHATNRVNQIIANKKKIIQRASSLSEVTLDNWVVKPAVPQLIFCS